MEDQSLTAVISVITSGVIAILSVIFPVINLLIEKARLEREIKAAESKNINEITDHLLSNLADFLSGNVSSATDYSIEKAKSSIISSFYAWERVVRQRLDASERIEIKSLRRNFEYGDQKFLYETGHDIGDKILEITDLVLDRIK
jgi:hypothetical protein